MPNLEYEPKPSIDVIHWTNEPIEREFIDAIAQDYRDVARLLGDLPPTMKIYFDDREVNSQYPADGTAYAHDILTLVLNKKFYDQPEKIRKQLRQTIFHEVFHIRQRFSLEDEKRSAIESAIYEGCATIFEREYTAAQPLHGNYSGESEETLKGWAQQMKYITAEEYFEPSGKTWKKWAFYDHDTGEQWKIYKTGTWIVDQVLATRNIDIIELRDVAAEQVLAWYEEGEL